MGVNLYNISIYIFIFAVLATSVYLSYGGNRLAKYFLWFWALLLLLAAPFISLIPSTLTDNVAVVTVAFFVYALVLIAGRNHRKFEIAHEELRRVLAESNKRMDEERRRIARRLHDDINPKLVLAKLELQKLAPTIGKTISDPEEAAKAHEHIEKILGFVNGVYQESRDIIKNTRVEIIDSIGLTAAIESLVGHYKGILEKPNIIYEHNLPSRPDLSAVTAVNVYRIIQEAVLNVIKHAEATQIKISVHFNKSAKCYDVSVVDDGIGINVKKEHGIGLIDMRERVRVLGGELGIENLGSGTKVSFSFSDRQSSNPI